MIVHVSREPAVRPGGTRWFELPDDELVFVVSAEGVSELGARALQMAWTAAREPGEWLYDAGVGAPATVAYYRREWDEGAVVHLERVGPHCDVYLSPRHFSAGSVRGIHAAATDILRLVTNVEAAVTLAS